MSVAREVRRKQYRVLDGESPSVSLAGANAVGVPSEAGHNTVTGSRLPPLPSLDPFGCPGVPRTPPSVSACLVTSSRQSSGCLAP